MCLEATCFLFLPGICRHKYLMFLSKPAPHEHSSRQYIESNFKSVLFLYVQEDKEPVFDSVKAIIGMLEVSAEFAQNITFNSERIQNALPAGHLDATTLADYLVKKVSYF